MSYAQLTRRYGPTLEALVVAAPVDDGVALFVPSTGFVGFHRCGKPPRRGGGVYDAGERSAKSPAGFSMWCVYCRWPVGALSVDAGMRAALGRTATVKVRTRGSHVSVQVRRVRAAHKAAAPCHGAAHRRSPLPPGLLRPPVGAAHGDCGRPAARRGGGRPRRAADLHGCGHRHHAGARAVHHHVARGQPPAVGVGGAHAGAHAAARAGHQGGHCADGLRHGCRRLAVARPVRSATGWWGAVQRRCLGLAKPLPPPTERPIFQPRLTGVALARIAGQVRLGRAGEKRVKPGRRL